MTTATKVELPKIGSRVELMDMIPEIIVAVRWQDEEPNVDGDYSAVAFTIDDSDPKRASYGVVWLGCTEDDHRWGVLVDNHFGTALEAADFYEYRSRIEYA